MLNTLVPRENLKAFFKWAKFPYFFHTKCLAMVICDGGGGSYKLWEQNTVIIPSYRPRKFWEKIKQLYSNFCKLKKKKKTLRLIREHQQRGNTVILVTQALAQSREHSKWEAWQSQHFQQPLSVANCLTVEAPNMPCPDNHDGWNEFRMERK